MTVVVDASAVVAALIDAGPDGEWARAAMRGAHLAARSSCRSRQRHLIVTLDTVIARAPGLLCEVRLPPRLR